MIPKIIHYCWLSQEPIPQDIQEYMKSWKKVLPDYEFMLWDFKRFDIESSIWVQESFRKKKYAFAADYIRLFAVYHYGGFYLDSDIEVLKSFNDLLHLKTAICWQCQNEGFEAACFGAEKGAPWLKECLNYYENRHFIMPNGRIDLKPLPEIIENALLNCGYEFYDIKHPSQTIDATTKKLIAVLPNEYFSPMSYKTRKLSVTPNTYAIHHFAASWVNPYDNQNLIGKILVFLHLPPVEVIWRFFHLPNTNIRGRLFGKR